MDQDSRLTKILKYLFRTLDEPPRRSSEASQATKSRFLTQAKRYKHARDQAEYTSRRGSNPVVRKRRVSYQAVFAILLVLLFLFAGGVGGTAYAAQGALPGEPLYKLKLSLEDTRILLAASNEDKLSLHLSFASERLSELQSSLTSGDETSLMAVKDNFDHHANRAQLIIAQDVALLSYENELERINGEYYVLVSNEEEQPAVIASLDETPTATPILNLIQTNTLTPTPEPTQSPTEEPTLTPDATPTFVESTTSSPSPTLTPQLEPSQTAAPTSTFVSTATVTNTVDVCSSTSLSSLWVDEQQVFRTVTNDGSAPIIIDQLSVDWPEDNEELTKVELDGDAIWDEKDEMPPSNIPGESSWKVGVDRIIAAGQSVIIMFQFEEDAESGGYSTTLTFDNGCQVQATN